MASRNRRDPGFQKLDVNLLYGAVIAVGAVFCALEVVPLVLIGFEAYENNRLSRATNWVRACRWPILFFVAVAFWNLVGAGLLGFLINPPLSLY